MEEKNIKNENITLKKLIFWWSYILMILIIIYTNMLFLVLNYLSGYENYIFYKIIFLNIFWEKRILEIWMTKLCFKN